MPIISHTVFQDDPLQHISWIDYRPPCVPQVLSPNAAKPHWTWLVRFIDGNGDGVAEMLAVRGVHRVAPHAAEPVPNVVGPVVHLEPCRRRRVDSAVLTPRGHGGHHDRMFTIIRRVGFLFFGHLRLYILLRHIGGEVHDIPDLPGDGRLKDFDFAASVESLLYERE